ncbi:hypothetical protein LCGC14_0673850 [marine sediment metagenome]|uniref:Uncharacterized protein n=1 Tax=marine sediment metagenome TaxID=412755 RepID=A0A0F9RAK8_9ZZZZ
MIITVYDKSVGYPDNRALKLTAEIKNGQLYYHCFITPLEGVIVSR